MVIAHQQAERKEEGEGDEERGRKTNTGKGE
jgi:hypothetical protein